MNAPATSVEVSDYLAAVQRLLDDLPEHERRDLIEDLEAHLVEVAAEDDGSLVERLGPPETYAAELRASAGLPPYVATDALPAAERLRRRLRASSLGTIAELPAVRAVRTFLPELRPAWWVVRGYLFAVIVDAMFFRANAEGGLPWPSFGNAIFGTVFVLACVVASIVAGRAATRDTRSRVLAMLANVAIVLTFAAALPRYEIGSTTVNMVAEAVPFGFLQHGDGAPITNICAYDSDGKRVKDVQLFDQDGRPIVGAARGKLGILREKLRGGPITVIPGEEGLVDPRIGKIETFNCPKELEDLQSKRSLVERGLIRKKLSDDGPMPGDVVPEKLRPFVGE